MYFYFVILNQQYKGSGFSPNGKIKSEKSLGKFRFLTILGNILTILPQERSIQVNSEALEVPLLRK